MNAPIFTGSWGKCHLQGIAVDRAGGYIYYSFTTKLVKARLNGEIVGFVDGRVGHLGCIAFCEADGCVYGSLEYKNDAIGKGILNKLGEEKRFADAFYVARFDVSKIDRPDMSAEDSDIMTATYLREVTDDFNGIGADGIAHKHGCSGIDGLTLAPLPGSAEKDKLYLYVAYGVYDDVNRADNDYQVILCYDIKALDGLWAPLDQDNMHRTGAEKTLHKYFVYTGNTRYGVQNLEYDRHTDSMLMAVYKGKKPSFTNYSLFAVDMSVAAKTERLTGLDSEGEVLTLKRLGNYDEASEVHGWSFPYGSTGMYSCGDGNWLIAHPGTSEAGHHAYIYPYVWNGTEPFRITAAEIL